MVVVTSYVASLTASLTSTCLSEPVSSVRMLLEGVSKGEDFIRVGTPKYFVRFFEAAAKKQDKIRLLHERLQSVEDGGIGGVQYPDSG